MNNKKLKIKQNALEFASVCGVCVSNIILLPLKLSQIPNYSESCVCFNPHPRICLLILETEEGRERDRDMDVKEKRLIVSRTHANQ